ncbi:MAG TPA: TRAP transporter fused permease subunit [Rhodospirillales bacterium]|nr:TRAP transporter fused permease subunit [Rhodospirillales bacterium]
MSISEEPPVGASAGDWSVRVVGGALGALLTFGSVAEAADLYRLFGFYWFTEQRLIGMLGIALALAFIAYPVTRGSPRISVPWYDWLAVIASVGSCAWVAYDYERIFENLHMRQNDAVISAIVIVLLVAEGLRRSAGKVLFVFMLFFIAFGLLGHFVPGQFEGRNVDIDRMFIYIALDSNGLVGLPMIVSTTIVIAFVFFGNLLKKSGGSNFFTDISIALMGRYRGGASKIAITASSLFGTVSGSAVSNVVSTGVVTIPLMRKAGYPAHVAGAIEAVASTGGQLMPPIMGAAAFLMAEFLQIPYKDVVVAAIIPALLYYAALFIQADLYAARRNIERVEEKLIPNRWPVIRAGWFYLIPFAIIIYALFELNLQPDTSALLGAIAVIVVGLFIGYKGVRMAFQDVLTTFSSTGIAVVQIVMIGAMAGIVIGVLNITGLGFALTQALIELAAGNLFYLLLMAAFVSIILGMGMPTLGVYLLLATLVAPSLVEVGVPEIAAHLFALYFGMLSMITPPVAIAAFAAATVANSDPMKTGFAAVTFGWSAYLVPFLFVLAPELLFEGNPFLICTTFVTGIFGIWLVCSGFTGYLMHGIQFIPRIILIVAGLALLLPSSAFEGAFWTDLIGFAVASFVVFYEYTQSRKTPTSW